MCVLAPGPDLLRTSQKVGSDFTRVDHCSLFTVHCSLFQKDRACVFLAPSLFKILHTYAYAYVALS